MKTRSSHRGHREEDMSEEEWVDEDEEPDPGLKRVTNAIIGAAIAVHRELGPGYDEQTYMRSLAIEFRHRGIAFARGVTIDVRYRGELVGQKRLDFIVEGSVIVELKAVENLTPLFTSQVISYLKATGLNLAILINFNVKKLIDGIRRIAY
jgi:GxxExxY protein